MPRKKPHERQFPTPEMLSVWRSAPRLTFCPKFQKASTKRIMAHIEKDKCERCLAVYRQFDQDAQLIAFLASRRN
jgi:hypothetical protein